MPQSLFRSFSADADQRSVSLARSDGFPGAFRLSSASIWEGCHQHVRRDSRMAKQEWSALKRVLMFTLQMAIGAVACAGAILAIFAWTGAKLAPQALEDLLDELEASRASRKRAWESFKRSGGCSRIRQGWSYHREQGRPLTSKAGGERRSESSHGSPERPHRSYSRHLGVSEPEVCGIFSIRDHEP
jgi:hypothetical protein